MIYSICMDQFVLFISMMSAGFVIGLLKPLGLSWRKAIFISAFLYLVIIFVIDGWEGSHDIQAFIDAIGFVFSLGFIAMIYGGLPGIFLGVVNAAIMILTRKYWHESGKPKKAKYQDLPFIPIVITAILSYLIFMVLDVGAVSGPFQFLLPTLFATACVPIAYPPVFRWYLRTHSGA
ncbi:hypothetical protein MASR2M15_07500 [Anaerolineales bacterium]